MSNKLRGRLFGIFAVVDGTIKNVAASTSSTISINRDMVEIVSVAEAKGYVPGKYEWKGTAEGVIAYTAGETPNSIKLTKLLVEGTKVIVYIGECAVVYTATRTLTINPEHDIFFTGEAYLEAVEMKGEVSGYAKYNIQFRGVGELKVAYRDGAS